MPGLPKSNNPLDDANELAKAFAIDDLIDKCRHSVILEEIDNFYQVMTLIRGDTTNKVMSLRSSMMDLNNSGNFTSTLGYLVWNHLFFSKATNQNDLDAFRIHIHEKIHQDVKEY